MSSDVTSESIGIEIKGDFEYAEMLMIAKLLNSGPLQPALPPRIRQKILQR